MYLMQEVLVQPGDAPLFSDAQWFDALLGFESELAQAQAECGLIPESAARDIGRACEAVTLDREKFVELARKTGAVGIALTKPLQAWLAQHAPDALPWLHWGSTTQDAVDTAHAILTRDAVDALQAELGVLCARLEELANEHAGTPMMARSLLQPAQITSFGFKCAQWLTALRRSEQQLRVQANSALCVQLGGAVGNRAMFGPSSIQVEAVLARRLRLRAPGHAWHTQRDAWMRLAMEVAVCSGSLAKLAKDWALMSQFEVGEVSEATRGSTSSAMPHKRNPVYCMQAIALTQAVPNMAGMLLTCMPQAHERALGEWQAEVAHWAPLWQHALGACRSLRLAAQGLDVHTTRMLANVNALQQVIFSEGFVQALQPFVGSERASQLVAQQSEAALVQGRPLSQLLESAITPLCSPDVLREANRAIAHAADLQIAAAASERSCRELLEQCSTGLNSELSHAIV